MKTINIFSYIKHDQQAKIQPTYVTQYLNSPQPLVAIANIKLHKLNTVVLYITHFKATTF